MNDPQDERSFTLEVVWIFSRKHFVDLRVYPMSAGGVKQTNFFRLLHLGIRITGSFPFGRANRLVVSQNRRFPPSPRSAAPT
jgi:hypothetical protein